MVRLGIQDPSKAFSVDGFNCNANAKLYPLPVYIGLTSLLVRLFLVYYPD
jgi:hypothetical protein